MASTSTLIHTPDPVFSLSRSLAPLSGCLRPLRFDVLRLLTLPLHMHRDLTITDAFSTKKHSARCAAAAATQDAHDGSTHSQMASVPLCDRPDDLSVSVLLHLLHHLVDLMSTADDTIDESLRTAKCTPIKQDDTDDMCVNTAEAMNPYELAEAMMPMWPAVGKVRTPFDRERNVERRGLAMRQAN